MFDGRYALFSIVAVTIPSMLVLIFIPFVCLYHSSSYRSRYGGAEPGSRTMVVDLVFWMNLLSYLD